MDFMHLGERSCNWHLSISRMLSAGWVRALASGLHTQITWKAFNHAHARDGLPTVTLESSVLENHRIHRGQGRTKGEMRGCISETALEIKVHGCDKLPEELRGSLNEKRKEVEIGNAPEWSRRKGLVQIVREG